jgi:HPt (histidine-containing phosphotransfer) domain-containing protein
MSDLDQRFASLRERFLERCQADWTSLSGHLTDDEQIEMAHRISGSAGMFGFSSLGAAAQDLEQALREDDGNAARLKARLLAELRALQAR